MPSTSKVSELVRPHKPILLTTLDTDIVPPRFLTLLLPSDPDIAAKLAMPIATLSLPTRMANWVDKHQLLFVGDLVRLAPADLRDERNLGRKTIADTRVVLEAFLGCAWEAPTTSAGGAAEGAMPSLKELGARASWDAIRLALGEAERAVSLDQMTLPARLRSFAALRGFSTLGDLAVVTRGELLAADNLGRATVADLAAAIVGYFAKVETDEATVQIALLDAFKSTLERLGSVDRLVTTRRAGLGGKAETLQEVGSLLGVSRERARQIEERSCKQLGKEAWTREARRRVEAALGDGAVPLAELMADSWWTNAAATPATLRFILCDVVGAPVHVATVDEEPWLARVDTATIEKAWSTLRHAAAAVSLPAPRTAFDVAIAALEPTLGKRLANALEARLDEVLRREDTAAGPGRVLAIGDTRRADVLTLLRAAEHPLHMEEIARLLGRRVHLPDEAVRLGRGTVGLRQHIPDFDSWAERLVPAAARIVRELGPDRQWSCAELLDELREEKDISDWLGPWVLVALVKSRTELVYLGRGRVALPGAEKSDERIFSHEAVEELLIEAGGPLAQDEVFTKVRERIGVPLQTLKLVLQRPQFVRVDAEHVGLLERDVPGGNGAIAEAIAEAEAVLTRRGLGLSAFQLQTEVSALSAAHSTWSQDLTFSVLHGDPRFRFSQSGAVGLASWESTRFPTRLELLRHALDEGGGRVSVDAVAAKVAAHYGEAPSRATILATASHLNASVNGEWIVAGKITSLAPLRGESVATHLTLEPLPLQRIDELDVQVARLPFAHFCSAIGS